MFITEGFGQAVGSPIEGFEGVGPVHYFAESAQASLPRPLCEPKRIFRCPCCSDKAGGYTDSDILGEYFRRYLVSQSEYQYRR